MPDRQSAGAKVGQERRSLLRVFEAGDQELVLRLAKVERGLQSRTEAVGAVRRESKTLQTLQSLELPFAVPELLLHLHWLAESQTADRTGGHGPEHYADLLLSILRRALALDANKTQT
jgi:hypothetical protein